MRAKAELDCSPLSSQTELNMTQSIQIDTRSRMLWLTCLQAQVVQFKQPEHQKKKVIAMKMFQFLLHLWPEPIIFQGGQT